MCWLCYPLPFVLAKCMGPIQNSITRKVGLFSKEFKETSMLFCNSINHFFSRSSSDLLDTQVAEEKVQPKSRVCQIK